MISRRDFGKYVGTGALAITVGSSVLVLDGCNVAQDIVNWEPTAVNALTGIENILLANGITFGPTVTLALTALKAALTDVLGAAQEYLATTPPPVGTLQKLKTALQDVVDNFGDFLTNLNLPGGSLFNLITGLVQIILGTIMGFVNQLPSGTTVVASSFAVGKVHISIIPVNRPTNRGFKKSWNSTLKAGSSGVNCPPSAYFKLNFFEKVM